MTLSEIKTHLEKALPGVFLKVVRESLLIENPADLVKVARHLKEAEPFKLDYLSAVTGADYLEYLESIYHFYSMEKRTGPVVLRVRVKRDKPGIPSLCKLYRSAELQEREAGDLFGIIYENHPDPRRLLMWEGFDGFPMRKDYVQEDPDELQDADIRWLKEHQVAVPAELKQKTSGNQPTKAS
jgi:NADH:ubiquinone oxidoreductase subunit C